MQHRVQGFAAGLAVKATLVISLSLGKNFLRGVDTPPAAGTTLPWGGFWGAVVLDLPPDRIFSAEEVVKELYYYATLCYIAMVLQYQ